MIHLASDLHLENPACDKVGIFAMLKECEAEHSSLMIIGDGLDFFSAEWTRVFKNNVSTVKELRERTKHWIVGNHDSELKEFVGIRDQDLGISFHYPSMITKVDGRMWMLEHGHLRGPLGWLFKAIEGMEKTALLRKIGKYVSKSNVLSRTAKMRFYHNCIKSDLGWRAKEKGCSVVIFGHTHIPEICEMNGITFVNPGSSFGGLTYVVYENGKFELRGNKSKL